MTISIQYKLTWRHFRNTGQTRSWIHSKQDTPSVLNFTLATPVNWFMFSFSLFPFLRSNQAHKEESPNGKHHVSATRWYIHWPLTPYCSIAGVNVSVLGLIVRSLGCEAPAEAVIWIDSVDFFSFFSFSFLFARVCKWGKCRGENQCLSTDWLLQSVSQNSAELRLKFWNWNWNYTSGQSWEGFLKRSTHPTWPDLFSFPFPQPLPAPPPLPLTAPSLAHKALCGCSIIYSCLLVKHARMKSV